MRSRFLLLPYIFAVLVATKAHAIQTSVSTSVDHGPNGNYFYLGIIQSLEDIDAATTDGWVINSQLVGGDYEYFNGQNVHGRYQTGDLLLGYNYHLKNGYIIAYTGGSVANHNLAESDPSNPINGTEFGLKVQAELYIRPIENIVVEGFGFYTTAFEEHWSRLRLGYDFGPVTVGPEVTFLGTKASSSTRFGGALTEMQTDFGRLYLYGGYMANPFFMKDGAYAGLQFKGVF